MNYASDSWWASRVNIWLPGCFLVIAGLLASNPAVAQEAVVRTDLMWHWAGILSLVVFMVAYALVISEETIHLRKSKPVMVAAGVIWALVAAYLRTEWRDGGRRGVDSAWPARVRRTLPVPARRDDVHQHHG